MGKKAVAGIVGSAIVAVLLAVLGIALINRFGGFGPRITEVTGVVGSEKEPFFDDPAVIEQFKKNGLKVTIKTAGSYAMAKAPDTTSFDFAFPSSEAAGQAIQKAFADKARSTYAPFYSPIAIASFTDVLQVLEANGLAHKSGQIWEIDMAAYLKAVAENKRWTDFKNNTAYPANRTVMFASTDIRSSNSASMYMALASYVMNSNNVVTSQEQANQQIDALAHLFTGQGYTQSSSAEPFERYLTRGKGEAPLVVVYEGQYLAEQMASNSRIRQDSMALAYPSPTVFSTHTGVTFTESGDKVMSLLTNDTEFAKLLAKHGFRTGGANSGVFDQTVADAGLSDQYRPAGEFVDQAQMPDSDLTAYLLDEIGKRYDTSPN